MKSDVRQPTIGHTVDRAMAAIERDNPALKEVLPKDYARSALDKQRLGQLIDMLARRSAKRHWIMLGIPLICSDFPAFATRFDRARPYGKSGRSCSPG